MSPADASWGPGVNSVNLFMRSGPNTANPTIKGLSREIFVAEICTQSKPVWVGDLGTRQNN